MASEERLKVMAKVIVRHHNNDEFDIIDELFLRINRSLTKEDVVKLQNFIDNLEGENNEYSYDSSIK